MQTKSCGHDSAQITKILSDHEALAHHFFAFVCAEDADELWALFTLTGQTFANSMAQMKSKIENLEVAV